MSEMFTLALPSKGVIAEPTDTFLKEAGLKVSKPNPRQYTGKISRLPALNVLFQRVKDVVYKVADGTAQLGITGLDVVQENWSDNLIILHDKLGYGHCDLVVAVPEAWVDVENILDLARVAQDVRDTYRRNLRIATTFPNLTKQFFHKHHIHHFTIVKSEGAIEAAPTIGYADIIVDLTQSGTTLRENHLKPIRGGTITASQACLIGNRAALRASSALRESTRLMLEYIDASLSGRDYYQLTADIRGDSPEQVTARVLENPTTRGLLAPTISPIHGTTGDTWYTVTLTIKQNALMTAVEHLRTIGGKHVIALPVKYVFYEQSHSFKVLLEALNLAE